jgi:hypothetical protein
MGRYAIVTNGVVTSIEDLEDDTILDRIRQVEMLIDITDLSPSPAIGWVLTGNTLQIPQGISDREAFEIDLNDRKSTFGAQVSRRAVNKIGARNKILNKNGAQVTALLTALLGIKALLETGALGTARASCVQLQPVYTEYADIFDEVITDINNFEINFGL